MQSTKERGGMKFMQVRLDKNQDQFEERVNLRRKDEKFRLLADRIDSELPFEIQKWYLGWIEYILWFSKEDLKDEINDFDGVAV
jgi:hypothetical protein